jgi:alpha-maltose-1-phosphate synthase
MNKKIMISLVCVGRFHLFDLARELYKRGMLKRIFTGYPRWKLRDEDIPSQFISTFPWIQTSLMALMRWGIFREGIFMNELHWQSQQALDRFVANRIPESDILFALSGSGLRCGQQAKQQGQKYFCDRGSSHIRYQNDILVDEYNRWGLHFPGIDKRIIEKEEAEYELADRITVPSAFAYQSFGEEGVSKHKLRKIPYGVNLSRFAKTDNPDPTQFNILFVGQVSFQKGVPYLLKAFNLLKHPNKHLSIIGIMLPEILRYLQNNSPPENVNFLGHIPQKELKHFMSRSHVMVLPSIQDGFGIVMAQALACGCPVIGTYNTGAEDLFDDGVEGFIVPIRDAYCIAKRLQELADDPVKREAMSDAALKRIEKIGGWHSYGENMVTAFHEALKND